MTLEKNEPSPSDRDTLYQVAFLHSSVAMAVLEDDSTISLVNLQFELLSGYSRVEIEGKNKWKDVILTEDSDQLNDPLKLISGNQSGPSREYLVDFITKSGNISVFTCVVSAIPGTKKCIVSLIDNPPEQIPGKPIESSSRFIETLIDALPVPVFYKDASGRYVGCNTHFEDYIGISRNELLGKSVYDISPRELADRYVAADEEVFKNFASQQYETQVRYANGVLHDVIFCKAPLFSETGSICGLIGAFIDISERKEAERRIRESEKKFLTVFLHNPVSQTLVSVLDGTFVAINETFLQNTGYSRDEVIGCTSDMLNLFPDMQEYQQMVSELRKYQNISGMELHTRIKSGETRICRFSSRIIMMENKPHILSSIEDITQHKLAEKRNLSMTNAFLAFSPDPIHNITLLTRLAGEMLNATCALYNRLESGMLCSLGQWNTPPDFSPVETPEGHICYDVIQKEDSIPTVISDLLHSSYAESDPNVRRYQLETYIGIPVKIGEKFLGSLCVVFQNPYLPSTQDLEFLMFVAKGIAVEDERRVVETELREREEWYSALVNHAPGPVVTLKGQTIVFINDFGLRLSGYSTDEMVGKNILGFLPEDSQRKVLISMHTGRESGKITDLEIEFIRKDGRIIQLYLNAVDLLSRGEKTTLVLLIDITERKRAETALLESEIQLANAMDLAQVVKWELDIASGIFTFDERFYSLYGTTGMKEGGYSMPALRYVQEFIHPDDIPMVIDEVHRILPDPYIDYPQLEHRIIRRDGEVRHIIVHRRGMRDPDGQMIKIFGANQDITSRKKAEETLKKSEARLQLALAGSESGMWEMDVPSSRGSFDERAAHVLGYENSEDLKRNTNDWFALCHPDDVSRIENRLTRYLKGESPFFESEQRMLHASGEWRWIACRGKITDRLSDGSPLKITGTMHDVTGRKIIEEAVLESEIRLRSVIDNIPAEFWAMDTAQRYEMQNSISLLNYGDLLGKSPDDLGLPEDLTVFWMEQNRRVLLGEHIKGEYSRELHGETRFYENYLAPVMVNQKVVGIVGVGIDVTDHKRIGNALKLANKKLHLLSGITRHDMNNQLSALEIYLDLCEKSIDNPTELQNYLTIEQQISRTLAHQIAFTKDYEDLGIKSPVWKNIHLIVSAVFKMFPVENIRVDPGDPTLEVFADPLLEKVFYNLIGNALRHGGEKLTEIRVSHRKEKGNLVIMVEDDGIGVRLDEKDQIFDKGFGSHTGLGLFLSREILSITGITIIENGFFGKGACFEIMVPPGTFRFVPEKT